MSRNTTGGVLGTQDGFLSGFEYCPPEPTNVRLRNVIPSGSRSFPGSASNTSLDLCRENTESGKAAEVKCLESTWVRTTFHRPNSELRTRIGLKQESGKGWARVGLESRHQVGTKSAPSRHQVTAQVERNLQEDSNTLSDNRLQILLDAPGGLERTSHRSGCLALQVTPICGRRLCR